MAGITLSELLKKMIEMGGSDLHLSTNSPPRVRVHGKLRPLEMPPLTAADTKALAYSVLTDVQKHRLEESLELDFSFGLKSLARFRGNIFHQRGRLRLSSERFRGRSKDSRRLDFPPWCARCATSRAGWCSLLDRRVRVSRLLSPQCSTRSITNVKST